MRPTPPPPHALIGRADIIQHLIHALTSGPRLLTVWGPAGVGKSAVLEVVAASLAGRLDVIRTALDPQDGAPGDADLNAAIGRALGLTQHTTPVPVAQLVAGLEARGPCLVVIDHAEGHLDAFQDFVEDAIPHLPETRFLVGSQVLLDRGFAQTCRIEPLSVSDAAALFITRAQAAAPGFTIAPDDVTLLHLVERLDRLPLAIELAARRAGVLGIHQLCERMARPLDILRDPQRPTRSYRSAMERAWAALDDSQQRVLAQLSVLQGGVRLALVEAVVVVEQAHTLDVVDALVARSLVESSKPADRITRQLRVLAPVRAFAAEQLAFLEREAQQVAERYRSTFEALGITLQRAMWRGERGTIPGFEDDFGSFLAAVDAGISGKEAWAVRVTGEALDLIGRSIPRESFVRLLRSAVQVSDAAMGDISRLRLALAELAFTDGQLQLAEDWLAEVPTPDPQSDRPQLLARFELAQAMRHGYSAEAGQQHVRAALAALPLVDDSDEAVNLRLVTLSRLAVTMCAGESFAAIEAVYRESLALATRASHRWIEMLLLTNYGAWLGLEGERQQAIVVSARALALAEALGYRMIEATAALNLGESHLVFEQDAIARGYLERAAAAAKRGKFTRVLGIATGYIGAVDHISGNLDAAEAAYSQAHAILASSERDALSTALLDMCMASLDCERGAFKRAAARFAAAEAVFVRCNETALQRALQIQMTLLMLQSEDRGVIVARAAQWQRLPAPPRIPPHPFRLQHVDFALRLVGAVCDRHWRHGPSRVTLTIDEAGAWFSIDDRPRVSLGRRRAPRRVLAFLAKLAVDSPGESISPGELFAVGWPNEVLNPLHAANRLYFAIATLRQLGLGDVIQHIGDGYRIDSNVTVSIQT